MIQFTRYNTNSKSDMTELAETLPGGDGETNYPPYPDDDGIFVAPMEVYSNGFFPFAVAILHKDGLTLEIESPHDDEDLVIILEWGQKDSAYVLAQLHERMDMEELLTCPGVTLSSRGEGADSSEEECSCDDECSCKCDCGCQDDDSDPVN